MTFRSYFEWLRRLGREDAAQLVEFAVSLPLLVVFVVGIFDFSGAYTLKQKLTNVARDAARTAASQSNSDLSATVPISISDSFSLIDNYFLSNGLNDCSINASSPAPSRPSTWTYFANGNGCLSPGLRIIINRGYYFPASNAAQPPPLNCSVTGGVGGQTAIISTCVSIQYSYSWRFGHVASLLGGTQILPSTISAAAVVMNEN